MTRALLTLLVLTVALPSSASHHPPITITEILQKSAAVVRAKIIEVDEAQYDFEAKEAFTHVRIEVLDALIGKMEPELTLVFRGGLLPPVCDENGECDQSRDVWDVIPKFTVGETYVLFLRDKEYFVTPLVSPYILHEVTVDGTRVLVDPEGRLVRLTSSYPQVEQTIVDEESPEIDERAREKSARRGPVRNKARARLPAKAQTEKEAIDVIQAVGKLLQRSEGEIVQTRSKSTTSAGVTELPKRPSSLDRLREVTP